MSNPIPKRTLPEGATLESLRKEAKRWHKALGAGDNAARERLDHVLPHVSGTPRLRQVQHALALEYGADSWIVLRELLADRDLAKRSAAERADDFLRYAIDRQATALAGNIFRKHPDVGAFSLLTAAVSGDLAEVERWLLADSSASSARGGPKNWQPLQYLCYARLPNSSASEHSVAITQALLDAGADPNATWKDDWDNPFTLLTGIIGEGEGRQRPHPCATKLAEMLIEQGADPFDTQSLYNTSLHADDTFWLDFLYTRSEAEGAADRWRSTDRWPKSGMLDYLLGNAVSRNHIRRSLWLLERGARAASLHSYSKRNLHTEAMLGGYTELAQILVDHGATPEQLSEPQAFQAACMRCDHDTVRHLLKTQPKYLEFPGPMYQAADNDRIDVARFLLEIGMSPDVSHNSWTALHACAHNGSVRVAKLLLEHGASIDIREKQYGATPLGHAQWIGQAEMIALLGSVSRDVFMLARIGNLERLCCLLDEEPQLIDLVHEGRTALYFWPGAEERAIEVAELLLARGADVGFTDPDGMTAADAAMSQGFEELAETLRQIQD
jgi:ankyrin repeat protein